MTFVSAISLILLLAQPASQTADEYMTMAMRTCIDPQVQRQSPDAVITACSGFIDRAADKLMISLAREALGAAYMAKQDYAKAFTEFDQIIRDGLADGGTYMQRGRAHLSLGRHDPAIADFSRVIQSQPRNTAALYNRGFAYHAKGDFAAAIADYTALLQLTPNDVDALSNRGRAHLDASRPMEAIGDFEAVLRLKPGDAAASANLAAARSRFGAAPR